MAKHYCNKLNEIGRSCPEFTEHYKLLNELRETYWEILFNQALYHVEKSIMKSMYDDYKLFSRFVKATSCVGVYATKLTGIQHRTSHRCRYRLDDDYMQPWERNTGEDLICKLRDGRIHSINAERL